MKKGIVLVGGYGDLSFEGALRLHKDAGFDGVEVIANEEGGWFHLGTTSAEIQEMRAISERVGVEIGSLMAGAWKHPLSDPDRVARGKGQSLVAKAIEGARGIGAKAVLVVPAVVNQDVSYEQAWERSQGAIKELVPDAERSGAPCTRDESAPSESTRTARSGVCLCIENVWNKFLLSPTEFCRLY